MKGPVERRSRACRNHFCPSKAPSRAFPVFTDVEEGAEQPRKLPPGPSVPVCLLITAPDHHKPRAGTAAPLQGMWRLNGLSSVLLPVLPPAFPNLKLLLWVSALPSLVCLFCLHCKVFGPGRDLQIFGPHSGCWGHLGCYHKIFLILAFPLVQ